MAALILQYILQYGPAAETIIANLISKLESGGTLTLADVEAEFAPLKPYSAYGIVKAFSPATPAPTSPPTPTPGPDPVTPA